MVYYLNMSLSICSVASGSKGNCVLLRSEKQNVLVDIGIPLAYLEKSLFGLGVAPGNIDCVLVTHEHSDHISGVEAFVRKYETPVFMHADAAEGIMRRMRGFSAGHAREFRTGFTTGDMEIDPIPVSHDVHCVGYAVSAGGEKISVVTDLGTIDSGVIRRIADSGILMLEANHDVDMLAASKKYPYFLKRRIFSERGHLSNEDCGKALCEVVRAGAVRKILLAHLSAENNYPELAVGTVQSVLKRAGLGAGVKIEAALQYSLSELLCATG